MFKIFKKYKDEVIKHFGEKPLYEDQIKEYGIKHFPNFGGVFAHDEFKPENDKCYVINTGNSKSMGYHWVGVFVTKPHLFIFDSFHRNPDKILHDLDKFKGKRAVVVSRWPEAIQKDYIQKEQNICGQLCLAWLHCIKDFGIRNAILI
jgi:hypothetical protein